jgi:serine/threonine protein kinase
MERINGISLRDAILGKEEFPKNFNFEEFFIELEKFIKIMHEEGIYHRDFHDGNIMIDSETGNPWLIDFGRSKKRVLTDENPYETDFGITLPDDLQQLSLVKKSTKESLELDMQYKGRRPEEFNPEEFYFDKPKTLGYKEVEQFSLNIKQSLLEMKENNLTEIEIKDGLGFYLVKDKTEAFEKRKNSKLILYPKTFQGDIYFVCRN